MLPPTDCHIALFDLTLGRNWTGLQGWTLIIDGWLLGQDGTTGPGARVLAHRSLGGEETTWTDLQDAFVRAETHTHTQALHSKFEKDIDRRAWTPSHVSSKMIATSFAPFSTPFPPPHRRKWESTFKRGHVAFRGLGYLPVRAAPGDNSPWLTHPSTYCFGSVRIYLFEASSRTCRRAWRLVLPPVQPVEAAWLPGRIPLTLGTGSWLQVWLIAPEQKER